MIDSRSQHLAHVIRLAFTAIFAPFQAVTQVFYNTCVTAIKRPLFPLGGRVLSLHRGVRRRHPPIQDGTLAAIFSRRGGPV